MSNSIPMEKYKFNGVDIYAPSSYVHATAEERAKVCNGIGPAWIPRLGIVRAALNRIWCLNCGEIGDIHDWMYEIAEPNANQKAFCDDIFQSNLTIYINAKTRWRWLRKLRFRRVHKYMYLLREWGFKSFYDRD